jgi:AcrR family transcriptional regulator
MADTTVSGPALSGSGERANEIRQVAADLFKARGYSATTMTNIADAAGVLPGSLYHHFESKEDIAVEILAQFDDELDTIAAALPARGELSPGERIVALVRYIMSVSQRNAAAVQLRAFEPPTVATQKLREARERRKSMIDLVWKEAVEDLTPRDGVRAGDRDLLRFALQDLAMNTAGNFPLGSDVERLARKTVGVLLHGVATNAAKDDDLDASEATGAADDAMSRWPDTPSYPGDEVRAHILSVARIEFARRGYDATTIRDVAAAAEVPMGTLYRRISSKEDMLVEIIAEFDEHFSAAIEAVFSAGDDEVATLDAMAKVFVCARRRFRAEADMTMFNWRIAADPNSPFGFFRSRTEERLARVVALVERGVERGTFRSVDPVAAAMAPHVRYPCWVPYENVGTSEQDTHQFLRNTLIRGYCRPVVT